jgi:hypothetical protein
MKAPMVGSKNKQHYGLCPSVTRMGEGAIDMMGGPESTENVSGLPPP